MEMINVFFLLGFVLLIGGFTIDILMEFFHSICFAAKNVLLFVKRERNRVRTLLYKTQESPHMS